MRIDNKPLLKREERVFQAIESDMRRYQKFRDRDDISKEDKIKADAKLKALSDLDQKINFFYRNSGPDG